MMEWTDRHCRYFLRLISKHALLYTEMVTADAVLRGDRKRLLQFHVDEHPVALQVGGSDANALAEAARIGAEFGYDEINLNVGCPSDRVQAGRFGACLMAEPALVADLIAAIVTDGAVRDVDGLARAGVPVFSAGLTPASPAANGPGTIGLPIVIGGRPVDAGDVVVCDRTGVVAVPRARAAEVAASLDRVLQLEAEEAERVAAGQVLPGAIRELLASDRVREIQ